MTDSEASAWSPEYYDTWFDRPWGRYAFATESAAVLAATGPLAARTVLDVGCGTGRLLSAVTAAGATAIGLDNDSGMLGVAARRTSAPLVRGDAAALPLRSAAVDVTIALAVLEFVADPPAVLAEMARVTRPGGYVVVGALNPNSPWGVAHLLGMRRPPWSAARFLNRRRLRELARPHGTAHLTGTLLAPGAFPGLGRLRPVLGVLERLIPWAGAFQVLSIQRRS